jgi:hypothetical protein
LLVTNPAAATGTKEETVEHYMARELVRERMRRVEEIDRRGFGRFGDLLRDLTSVIERPRGVPPARSARERRVH